MRMINGPERILLVLVQWVGDSGVTLEGYRLMAEKPEISKVCGTKTGVLKV